MSLVPRRQSHCRPPAGPTSHGLALGSQPRRDGTRRLRRDRERRSQRSGQRSHELLRRLPPQARAHRRRGQRQPTRSSPPRGRSASASSRACRDALRRADRATARDFVRVEELVYDAADAVPGLTPTRQQSRPKRRCCSATRTASRSTRASSSLMCWPSRAPGTHLCHAMLLPRPRARRCSAELAARRRARSRRGAASSGAARPRIVTHEQPALPQRRGRDHARRDGDRRRCRDPRSGRPRSRCCAAASVEHPKYRGRRIFGAGINLTHLYRGKIPFLWYLQRDLGFVHKMLARRRAADALPDDVHGARHREALDRRGRGLRDRRPLPDPADDGLRARGATMPIMTLPARKEGIIPGRRQSAPAALHRRPHRAPGDPVRAPARLRQPGRPADLRRDRAGRRDGRARSSAWSPG